MNGNAGNRDHIRESGIVCFNFGYGFESKIIMINTQTVELKNNLPAFILGFTSFEERSERGG